MVVTVNSSVGVDGSVFRDGLVHTVAKIVKNDNAVVFHAKTGVFVALVNVLNKRTKQTHTVHTPTVVNEHADLSVEHDRTVVLNVTKHRLSLAEIEFDELDGAVCVQNALLFPSATPLFFVFFF